MKVLVTGGAGFIGSHIIDALCEAGASVLCIDSLDPGVHHAAPSYLRKDVDYCFVDLRHWTPDSRFADIEAIVHLAALGGVARAAREWGNVLSANAAGTARLVEYARGLTRLKRVVLAGSFSVYGSNYSYRCTRCEALNDASRNVKDLDLGRYEVACKACNSECEILPILESTSPNPLEAYAASKYMQELAFRGAGLPLTILRFSSAYGTRLRLDDGEATIIAKLAGWIRSGIKPKLFEDGQQIRDWVHVRDIVGCVAAILKGAPAEEVINVCSGSPNTLQEACVLIGKACGRDGTPEIVGGYRPGDMRHCLGDTTRMQKLLGRKALQFSEGVQDLVG
jgi:dTDP-L-rhamnose 4-epimerase